MIEAPGVDVDRAARDVLLRPRNDLLDCVVGGPGVCDQDQVGFLGRFDEPIDELRLVLGDGIHTDFQGHVSTY